MLGSLGAGLAALFGPGILVQPAAAAVRHCVKVVIAVGTDPASEVAARKQALDGWIGAAAKLGPQWTSWRLATSRDFRCESRPGVGYVCRASASPCAITQNPAKPAPIVPEAPPAPAPTAPVEKAPASRA